MKRLTSDAIVELSADEVERFKIHDSFKEEVFQAANKVSSLTGRTVIVATDTEDFGFWKYDGFHFADAKEDEVAKGHAKWCYAPAGVCTCGRTSPKVHKFFGKD